MQKIIPPQQFRSFLNGRIGGVSDYLLPGGAVTTAKNVHFDTLGKVTLRPGVTLINSQISNNYPCLGLYYFKSSTAAYSQLLSVFSDGTNNDIYYKNGASWTKTLENDTKDLKTRFTTFLDRVIKVNGTETAFAWNGNEANWTQAAGVTANCLNLDDMDTYKCTLIENFKQKVYMAGDVNFPSRLYYSSTVSSTPHIDWAPLTDYIDINPNDGDKTTALKKYSLDELVFKQNYMYRYRGIAGVDPEPLIKLGTYSQEGVVEAKNGVYFHHPSGIYLYNGGYPTEISRPVADFIDAIPSTYYATVSAWTDPDHVYYSIGDVTVGVAWTNVVLRYTISSEVWTVYSYGTELRRGTTWDNGTNEVRVAGDDDGNVFTFDSGLTDNGTAIQYGLVTKFLELGLMAENKIINTLAAICEKAQGSILAWQTNDETAWHTIGQLREYVTLFKNQKIKGHRIRFELFGSSDVTPFIFEGLELLELKSEGI